MNQILQDVQVYGMGFLDASLTVLCITILTIFLSWIFGLLAALGKLSSVKFFRAIARFYIWFIRGTPALIQVFIVYFGVPQFGIHFSPFFAGVVALALNSGAYVAEIIRSGLNAIPRSQMESAFALGMSQRVVMIRIILPQVFRIILPPLTNEAISALKNTSLLSTITVIDITLYAQTIISATFRPFEFYIAASLIYLLLTTVLTELAARIERSHEKYH
ncbi:amino acid ABC transporter permease [Erwinia endophytica]|uniref:amino acid ABC transporter permease n=1 Tax=Erwinia endophytica TaxID=1563158 RepID=UPI0012660676|nr:amino acid ABC transporter permease [Erwinia endophytica]KAB8306215.1 amino acid ABC transporter permease [Erwinia endophytica]